MPPGTCKLCLQQKEIVDSHLMPAGVFRLLRGTKWSNPNPAVITTDWIGQSSQQVTDYVFCSDCEHAFNTGGERWLISRLARTENFPLYEVIAKYEPLYAEDDFSVYHGAVIKEIDADQITHFGMGIFWKAAIHTWKSKGPTIHIGLGPYAERVRRFLLGAPFPENIVLWVCVVPPSVPLLTALMPLETSKTDFYMFTFYVPGVEFTLCVGKQVPALIREGCFANSPLRPLMLSTQFAFTMGRSYRKALMTARISEKYARQREAARKS